MENIAAMMGAVGDSFERGEAKGRKRRLNSLAAEYYQGGANPELLGNVARVGGPEAAAYFQKAQESDQERQMKEVAQYAGIMLSAPDEMKPQVYESKVRPFLQSRGLEAPEWSPEILPVAQRLWEMHGGGAGAQQKPAQQQYLEFLASQVPESERQQVYRVAAGTDPRARAQLYEGQGGAFGVNLGGGQPPTATPIMLGGLPQASTPSQSTNGLPPNMMDFIANVKTLGGRVTSGFRTAKEQADLRAAGKTTTRRSQHEDSTGVDVVFPNPQAKAQAIAFAQANGINALEEGNHVHFGVPRSVDVTGGAQLQPAQKPVNPNDAARLDMERERLRLSQNADARAETTANRPPPISTQERKDMLARRAKIPQLQNSVRGLDRIKTALQGVSGGMVNTGPMDQGYQRYTKQGQELEAAVGAIQNSMLSLTRVPGIGSQSDLEARIAALQYPSLDKAPEVNARTVEQLEAFVTDLAQAYQIAAESDRDMATGAAHKPAAPGAWSIKAVD